MEIVRIINSLKELIKYDFNILKFSTYTFVLFEISRKCLPCTTYIVIRRKGFHYIFDLVTRKEWVKKIKDLE